MKYNVSSTVNGEKKFEVIETTSKDKAAVIAKLHKKYPNQSIKIKSITENMSANGTTL